MNELLIVMSNDMGIRKYQGESEESFVYRLCYSALGLWCLQSAQNSSDGITGVTKHSQTILLNELIQRYSEIFPNITDKFIDANNPQANFPVHIRRICEETGYLITDKNNRNQLANFGRTILLGSKSLFFGIPSVNFCVNGLGVFSEPASFKITTQEFLIRDSLTSKDYFKSQFDHIDFYEKDLEAEELEFFNPLSSNVPSMSWRKNLLTDCTVARKLDKGLFYKVMKESDTELLFADEPIVQHNDSFTSYEFRRLYFALKAYYNNPLVATITKKDEEYSVLRLGGHLPNREYYFLLLISWPLNNAFDKVFFLLKNEFVSDVTTVLTNIGIEVKGGNTNA